tara:strand:+ start:1602 stop:2201 length:600 start_codon:yes stop_codon:yes gene_type:complete
MIERKKKLRITQFILLISGLLIIFFTYINKEKFPSEQFINIETQEKIEKQLSNQEGDVFFDIEYTGLDLAGNRYVLKSKEAITDKLNQERIKMKNVEAIFYFKDDTILKVWSEEGTYNNRTLDMMFNRNIKALYEGSELYAQRADFSNSNGYLTITEDVKVKDFRGTMVADKLLFDIKKQTLDIASFNDGKINANINLK